MLGTELVAEGLWFSARHLESLGTWDAPGEHQQRCVAYTGDDVGEVGKDGVCEECLCAVTPGCAAVLCIPALPKGPRLFWEHIPGAPCALPWLTRWIERPNGSASVPRVCRTAGVLLQPCPVPVLVREPSRWSSVPVLRDARAGCGSGRGERGRIRSSAIKLNGLELIGPCASIKYRIKASV